MIIFCLLCTQATEGGGAELECLGAELECLGAELECLGAELECLFQKLKETPIFNKHPSPNNSNPSSV